MSTSSSGGTRRGGPNVMSTSGSREAAHNSGGMAAADSAARKIAFQMSLKLAPLSADTDCGAANPMVNSASARAEPAAARTDGGSAALDPFAITSSMMTMPSATTTMTEEKLRYGTCEDWNFIANS